MLTPKNLIKILEPFPEGFNIPFRICTEEEIKKSLTKACFFPHFSPIFYKVEDCLTMTHRYLYGYLQDERFFAEEKDKIKEIFEFTEPLSDKLKSLSDKIQNNNSVSVHIRRGDYLKNPKIFPTMPLSYYEDGADYIQSKTKEPIHLFVFSDDTEWVTKNFKSKHSFTIVPQNSTIEDLHLMSLCQHNIIANSTYSWWAAYLNKNPNKIVIAPDYWSDKLKKWGKDIVLKDWIILHVKKDEK